jgi:hypothetical protein
MRKQKRDDDNYFDYLYGFITTARNWHFLLYTPGKISQGSKFPFSIEFSEDALIKDSIEHKTLCNGDKKVLGVIVGLLKEGMRGRCFPSKNRGKSFEKISV